MAEPLNADSRIARAQAGDEPAFTELYDEFAPRIYRFLMLRVREPADAEDLLQRVFLKVIEALPTFEERGLPFAAWLFRIARNMAIDFERGRRPATPLEELVERPDELPGPVALTEQAIARQRFREVLSTLTADQREVIVYRFLAGLSAAEIGKLMGKREGTIRALQFRALQALRRLGRETFEDLVGGAG